MNVSNNQMPLNPLALSQVPGQGGLDEAQGVGSDKSQAVIGGEKVKSLETDQQTVNNMKSAAAQSSAGSAKGVGKKVFSGIGEVLLNIFSFGAYGFANRMLERVLSEQKNRYEKENADLKDQISSLKDQNKKLEEEFEKLKKSIEGEKKPVESEKKPEPKAEAPKPEKKPVENEKKTEQKETSFDLTGRKIEISEETDPDFAIEEIKEKHEKKLEEDREKAKPEPKVDEKLELLGKKFNSMFDD